MHRTLLIHLDRLWYVDLPRLLRRASPRVAGSVRDGSWTSSLPGAAGSLLPLAGIAVGVLLVLIPDVSYTESIVLLAVAVTLGIVNPAAGVGVLAAYVMCDVFTGATLDHPYFAGSVGLLPFLGSRLVLYMVLGLLAVQVAVLSAEVARAAPDGLGRWLRPAVFGIAAAAFAWLWTEAAVVLIRPAFTWRGVEPSLEALDPIRDHGGLVAVAAGVAGVARCALLQRAAVRSTPDSPGADSTGLPARPRIRALATAAATTLLLGGFFTSPWWAALTCGVLFGTALVRTGALALPAGYVAWITGVPVLVRMVAAPLLAMVLTRGLVPDLVVGTNMSSLLVPALATIVILTAAFPHSTARAEPRPVNAGAVAAGVLLIMVLASGDQAFADNCGFKGDTCFGAAAAAIAAAIGAGVLAWGAANRVGGDDEATGAGGRDQPDVATDDDFEDDPCLR